jgi:biotin-(acetyl-CoA carboxylase) ligase
MTLLAALLTNLQGHYDAYTSHSRTFPIAQWRQRAALIDEQVEVTDRGEVLSGTFLGVDGDGTLLLQTRDGLRHVVAGDLSRGPVRNAH